MKFKVKDMDIATGGLSIVLLNEKDALKMDLHAMDRVVVRKGKKTHTAVVDIGETKKAIPPGRIGFFEEMLDDIKAKAGEIVDVSIAKKPVSVQYIKKKLDGKKLTKKEIDAIINDVDSWDLDNLIGWIQYEMRTRLNELSTDDIVEEYALVNDGR